VTLAQTRQTKADQENIVAMELPLRPVNRRGPASQHSDRILLSYSVRFQVDQARRTGTSTMLDQSGMNKKKTR
jgi:hypothetical protein